ncbi:MAG: ATP-binding cassette domain-containing protein [Lachnospiraceae bacterium]|nr:ATP-binding cassette domain-containing protein [Lachnospiraceae bacterium]
MNENKDKKVLLSLKNVDVKFNVRGRTLSAIRNVSLDVYENEALAIVGESGSGKSVLTKTFAGLLDSNGYISNGTIILSDDEISKTEVVLNPSRKRFLEKEIKKLNEYSVLERGAAEFVKYGEKKKEIEFARSLSEAEEESFASRIKEAKDNVVDVTNYIWTLDKKNPEDAKAIVEAQQKVKVYEAEAKKLEDEREELIRQRKAEYGRNANKQAEDKAYLESLLARRQEKIAVADDPSNELGLKTSVLERNKVIAYEILLSIGRYPMKDQIIFTRKLNKAFKLAMSIGEDLSNPEVLNKIFESVAFRVEFRSYDEATETVHGYAILDCAKIKYTNDWQQIRGCRIATVFQDPMTSLNPVITIGKQIMTVILKHQKCSKAEARERTIDIMGKVGIPDPEKRFDDYPFEYSGGMRQRIVIAIALSCQPKILICDEPTTALDVTIQAQIIRLIKDLQKELGFTTVYITHDLGVVANVAERVAVIYGGQIVEVGTVDEIFYDPKHPYTWALLSSLPQLAERGTDLFSIQGTPPSLYNKIVGDAFAPRNQYALAIDFIKEPPVFQVSETHFAKTWLLDPRAPKVEKPENICNLHEKMLKTYVDFGE